MDMDSDTQTIVELLSLEFQRFKRYGAPGTLVVIETRCRNFFPMAESQTRKLDLLQQINTDLYVIVYAHTTLDAAKDALKNILDLHRDRHEPLKIGMCEVHKDDTSELQVVQRAFAKMHSVN